MTSLSKNPFHDFLTNYRYLIAILASLFLVSLAHADPEQDRLALKQLYADRFPELKFEDYANGVYAIDPEAKESWLAIEEFPPYEPAIENGEALFKVKFKNGKSYADCFERGGIGISQTFPKWQKNTLQVQTLAKAINDCREQNQELPLPYNGSVIVDILAYMVYTSRDKAISIVIPADEPDALQAYLAGKNYYYQRRGQLNFSCASCHIQNAGKKIRSEMLSPMLGQVTNWPTYRLKWGEMGTFHRRIIGCHKQIRATPPKTQSIELRNLEYFMSYMSNGLPVNGPSTRK